MLRLKSPLIDFEYLKNLPGLTTLKRTKIKRLEAIPCMVFISVLAYL